MLVIRCCRGDYHLFPLAMGMFSKKEHVGHWAELMDDKYIVHVSEALGTKSFVQWGVAYVNITHTDATVCRDKLYCKCDGMNYDAGAQHSMKRLPK